jgi:hypothetical protein
MKTSRLVLIVAFFIPCVVSARVWTDSTGRYKIDADLVAFNDKSVILQRADHELGQIPLEKLSQADREFLKTKEAGEAVNKLTGATQTWTLKGGGKIIGRVVGYARRQLTATARGGNLFVNDRLFENLPKMYQLMVPKIIGHSANAELGDKQALVNFLTSQPGQMTTVTVDGVMLQLETGDQYIVPFVFFSDQDLYVLQSGWDQWLAANSQKQYDEQRNQEFLLQSLLAARQRDEQIQRQVAMMQLNQALFAGVTSLWEVTLYPARGTAGAPQWVVMPGTNSGVAARDALAQHPGYVAGPVRRIAGY